MPVAVCQDVQECAKAMVARFVHLIKSWTTENNRTFREETNRQESLWGLGSDTREVGL